MKFGGLPFHQYVYSRLLRDRANLSARADHEMISLAGIVFDKEPQLTQLPMFMMMSYAERVNPGAIYRNSHHTAPVAH